MHLSGKQILIAIIFIQLIALPIILIAANNQQETRSRASEPKTQTQTLPQSGMAEFKTDAQSAFQPETQMQRTQTTQTARASGIANNPKIKKEVYAFIWYPYVDSDGDNAGAYLQYPYMTTLAYAGLSLGKDGNINKNDSSYRVWESQRFKKIMTDAKAAGVKIHPRIATFDSDRVNYLLATEPRRQKAIASIIDEIKNAPVALDGVNIDFEPVPTQSRSEFTDFIKNLRAEMDRINPDLEIVIDTFASTAISEGGFDLKKLTPYVNGFFVMSFTLVSNSADKAGSHNPDGNLASVADQYLAKVPSDKIILGFPFYTSRWRTADNTYRSQKRTGGGGLILYNDAAAEGEAYGLNYDNKQKTAWYSYYTCGPNAGWNQVYFDNEKAHTEKFQIANAKNLKGVGFWTFNQDKGSLDVWKAIYNVFADQSELSPPSPKPGFSKTSFSPNANCKPPSLSPSKAPSNSPTPRLSRVPVSPTPTIKPTGAPTPSPSPNDTVLRLGSIKLHGIGSSGDSTNPDLGGNKNPLTRTRQLTVELYNTSGNLVSSFQGNIVYGNGFGDFSGNIILGSSFNPGSYIVKIKTSGYLRKQLSGIITINKASVNQAPQAVLIAGDSNGDGLLSILDYSMILDCYSDLRPAKNCNPDKKAKTDLSDDGKVDQDDYNLFLRELSVRQED